MKLKNLFVILSVAFILLIYNLFCYGFANNAIDNGTKNIITNYFKTTCNNCDFSYEYIKATMNEDNTINVFVSVDSKFFKEYYRFIVIKNGANYQIINVNTDIPAHIKKPL